MLDAYRELQELTRQECELNELQGAQICNLTYNINRDTKKGSATSPRDWQFFRKDVQEDGDKLPSIVANICLALRHEGILPRLLLGIWKDVVKQASESLALPETRCLVSADEMVAVVAPLWESRNVRAFLAVNGYARGAEVELTDIDRPMLSYKFMLPRNIQAVHYEAGVLLLSVDNRKGLMTVS